MSGDPVIEINNMSFSRNKVLILEAVELAILPGSFISVIGPNGGGKTTLFLLILGLLKPDKGRVRLFGRNPREARNKIGYVPQVMHFDPQFPITVWDIVLMGRLGKGAGIGNFRRSDKEAAKNALIEMGLYEERHRPFMALSGGQRQRVVTARALATEPELLLLDEPTAHMDSAMQSEFYELLRKLNKKLTIILVTHDMGFVSHYVTSVLCVNRHAAIHPTSEITGEIIQDLYGRDVRLVQHDHRCILKEDGSG